MNFCSKCGSNKIVFSIPEGDHRERYNCLKCETIHYQNPRVIAGCIAYFEDRVLLCKRNIEPRKGYWTLTAGFMENGETVEEGALREAFEEACVSPAISYLACVYSVPFMNQVHVYYAAALPDDSFELTPESEEICLFSESEIPWKDLAFPSVTFAVKAFFENLKNDSTVVHRGKSDETFH